MTRFMISATVMVSSGGIIAIQLPAACGAVSSATANVLKNKRENT
jgi:hypothetical protein